jgi:hypothetical protein
VPPEEMLAMLNKVSGNPNYKDKPREATPPSQTQNQVAQEKAQEIRDQKQQAALHR